MSPKKSIQELPKGYRVHFDRLRGINKKGEFVKTHKYKLDLSKYDEEELWTRFSQVGNVVDSSKEGSLLYFIFQLVNLGFVFASKPDLIPHKKAQLGIKVVDPIKDLIDRNNLPIKDSKSLLVFLKQTASKSKTIDAELKNIFEKGLSQCFLGYNEKLENLDSFENTELKEIFLLIKERRKSTAKKISPQDKLEIFSTYFKVDFTSIVETLVDFKETFFIQHLSIRELRRERSYQEIVLERLLPTLDKMNIEMSGKSITEEILGAPNGWSRLLGTTIKEFQKGRGSVKDILIQSDPEYFSVHKEELEFLSEKIHAEAQKVPSEDIEFISHNWAKYRNLLGGRVQGWLSNFINRLQEYPNVIVGNEQKLSVLLDVGREKDQVFQILFGEDYQIQVSEIINLGNELNLMSETNLYNDRFSQMIEQYNYLVQDLAEKIEKHTRESVLWVEEKSENINDVSKVLKGISKKNQETGALVLKLNIPKLLPKYPRFIGESKQDIGLQLQESMQLLKVVYDESKDFFYTLLGQKHSLESDNELLKKRLQSLINLYKRSHPSIQSSLKSILNRFIDLKHFSDLVIGRKVVYQSNFVRRKKEEVLLKNETSTEILIEALRDFLEYEESSFETFFELSEAGIPDWIPTKVSLLKMYWALMLRGLHDSVNLQDKGGFSWLSQSRVGRFLGSSVSKGTALRLLQSGYGSEMSGQSSFLTKKSYIDRIVIQNMGSDDKGQSYLEYCPFEFGELSIFSNEVKEYEALKGRSDLSQEQKNRRSHLKKILKRNRKRHEKRGGRIEFSLEIQEFVKQYYPNQSNQEIILNIWSKGKHNLTDLEKEILRQIPHRWSIINESKIEFIQGEEVSADEFLINKKGEAIQLSGKLKGYKFPLLTSGHQLQFFDKFLSQEFDHQVEMMGTSLIFERINEIKWEGLSPKILTVPGTYNLYIAIPWKFSNKKEGKAKDLISYQNYMGVDLGEYGIGWAVLDKETAECVNSGFIEFPLLKSLRDEADSWKLKQAEGTFSTSTTRLARIRENATGQIRNLIHSLALEYKAIPVYEKEVDAFESGGNKIKKLYKSLKTSDVYAETEADNSVKKKIWGNQFGMIGAEVSAYLTSQTCRCCGRCATYEIYDLVDGNRNGKLTVTSQIIEGSNIICNLEDGEYPVREVWKSVKSSQRESTNSGKGGQDQFVCQYSDCENVCNADEQAAKNIALKKFAYETKGKTKDDYLQVSLDYAERNA